jgi:hypothetical protein
VLDDPFDETAAPRRARRSFGGAESRRRRMLERGSVFMAGRPRDACDVAIDAIEVDLALVGVSRMPDDIADRAECFIRIGRVERFLS